MLDVNGFAHCMKFAAVNTKAKIKLDATPIATLFHGFVCSKIIPDSVE